MREINWFDQIEDYLKNRLSPEDRQAFEARIAADPTLAGEVELHRDMMQAIGNLEDEELKKPPGRDLLDLREIMENAYQEYLEEQTDEKLPPTPVIRKRGWMPFLLATLVAFILICGVWLMRRQPETPVVKDQPVNIDTTVEPIAQTPEKQDTPDISPKPSKQQSGREYAAIVRDVYDGTPYAPGVLMSDDGQDPVQNPLTEASKAFVQNKNAEVVQILKNLPDEGRTEALKLRAHAFFRLNRFEQAATDFETLSQSALQKKDAEWYLLLCYAARLPKSKTAYEATLLRVAANGPKYAQRVVELKNRLNRQK